MAAPDFVGQERDAAVVIDSLRDPSAMVSNRVIFDAKDTLMYVEPDSAPFFTLVSSLREKRKATQYRYDVFEKPPLPRIVTLTAQALIAGVTLTASATEIGYVRKYDLLLNTTTREVVRVTAVASSTTLTVVRAFGGSPNAQMEIGEKLLIMGEAAEDGSDIGSIKSSKEEDVYNYTQIFRRAIGWTGRQMNTDMYGGKDPNTERRSQAIEHKKDIELSFLFGKRHSTTGANSLLVTATGGFEYFATKNVWDLQGNEPNENQFVEFLEWAMRDGDGGNTFGKGVKWLFSCDRLITIIERWARDRVRYVNPLANDSAAKKLNVGLRVGEFTTSFGTVMFVRTPAFRLGNEDRAVLVDMEHVRYVYHQGRDTKLLSNRQGNGEDNVKEEWFSDVGIEIVNNTAHSWITNVPV